MDATRRLLRTPPSPSPSASSSHTQQQHTTPPAEWSSPSFTRARARPSNLHSYLRSSPFAPNTTPSSQRQRHARGSSSDASSASPSAVRVAAASATNRTKLRSQRAQATQTATTEQPHSYVPATTTNVHLGSFGDVSAMALDTVDFLIRVLEDRKQELLVPPEDTEHTHQHHRNSSNDAHRSTARTRKNVGSGGMDDEYTESSDASDTATTTLPSPLPVASADTSMPAPVPTRVVRSRSYEALVQLESILEARHQQLMNNGVLEPGMVPPYALS